MLALRDAEYREADEFRAKVADEFQWLGFETKMRKLIQEILDPVIVLAQDDR